MNESEILNRGPVRIQPGIIGNSSGSGSGASSLPSPSLVTSSGAVTAEVTPHAKASRTVKEIGGRSSTRQNGMVCTTQKRRITAGSGKQFLLDPALKSIWPGAILEASSVADGSFSPALSSQRRNGTPASKLRNPIQLSISQTKNQRDESTGELKGNTATVQIPSQGSTRTAKADLLDRLQKGLATKAAEHASIHRVSSSAKTSVELGAHYNSPGLKIDNTFDYSNRSETNKFLAKYWQGYYSVDVSNPNPVANGFVTDPGTYLRGNDAIVTSVTYGRMLLFSAESKHKSSKLKDALSVALGGNKADLTVEHRQTLHDTDIHVQVLGGAATDGAKLISKAGESATDGKTPFDAVNGWIRSGARFDPKTSPGVPLAYQMRYVSNLDLVNTYLTTTYTDRSCRPTTAKYKLHNFSWKVNRLHDPGNKAEIYGGVYVHGWPVTKSGTSGGEIQPRGTSHGQVWHRHTTHFIKVPKNERKPINADAMLIFDDIDKLDRSRSYIEVTAVPGEHDGSSKDEFRNPKTTKWFLSQNPTDPNKSVDSSSFNGNGAPKGSFKITWSDGGTELELAFDVSPVPP